MKLRLKGFRFAGSEPVVFKNPNGVPVYLKKVGDETVDLDVDFAHKLLSAYGDILEVVTSTKVQSEYADKMQHGQSSKGKFPRKEEPQQNEG